MRRRDFYCPSPKLRTSLNPFLVTMLQTAVHAIHFNHILNFGEGQVDYDFGLDPFKAEKAEFNRAIDSISQLPNLEMNFHRGDSLHDHISGIPIVIMPDKASHYSDDFDKIAKLGEQLHQAKRAERKRWLRVQILEKRLALSRRILEEEIRSLDRDESSLDKLFHDETESSSDKRKRISQEKARLKDALVSIEKDSKELEKLSQRKFDNQFYVKLRKLEGADFDSPFNFVWYIDFPSIFSGENGDKGGFDIIVGNPPFVTARNPQKRELWRNRWPRVCSSTYQLVCPFFEVGSGMLRRGGELGYIVSDAFAKRNFGKPLVENFLTTVDLQKIVDCSGLMFPGHGTPTCLIFGRNSPPHKSLTIRVIGVLPGGGDLKTPPEESPLWQTIARVHDQPGFLDSRLRKVAVDMEVMAAIDGDLDFPDELVLPFIINAVTDKRMLEERSAAAGGSRAQEAIRQCNQGMR